MNERALNARFLETLDMVLFAHKEKIEAVRMSLREVETHYDECLKLLTALVEKPEVRKAIYGAGNEELFSRLLKYVDPRDYEHDGE